MENNENKNNKGLIILIVVFSLIVLGLGGWMIYDKLYGNDVKPSESENVKDNQNTNNEQNEQFNCVLEDLNGEILSFPTENDSSVKVTRKSFEETDEYDAYTLVTYKYNNYVIEFSNNEDSSGIDYIKITDKNNKVVYSNDYVKIGIHGSMCVEDDYELGKSINAIPTISNGKLYFVNLSTTCFKYAEDDNWPYYSYNYIDLNTDASKVVNIQNLKLMMDGADFEPGCVLVK